LKFDCRFLLDPHNTEKKPRQLRWGFSLRNKMGSAAAPCRASPLGSAPLGLVALAHHPRREWQNCKTQVKRATARNKLAG